MNTSCIDNLKQSPMFQLSLSSKELFHSNFLYWISQIYPEMFRHIITQLFNKADPSTVLGAWPESFEIRREYNNFDLCVTSKENDSDKAESVWLVVENKVKSIPNISQLNEYSSKSKGANHLLLSLSTSFPKKEEIAKELWAIADYGMLSSIFKECVSKKLFDLNSYHTNIIMDYAVFIENLHELQKSWHIDMEEEFITPKKERLDGLRINDLQEKHRYSNLYSIVKQEIEERLKVDVIEDSSRAAIFSETHKPQDRNVFLGWGMTRAQGLLEAKIIVGKNVVLLVQIQGNQYRHCIELRNNKSADQNWEDYGINNALTAWFVNSSESNEPFRAFKASPTPLDIRPDTTRNNKKYNQYGNNFLYKSITIPGDATKDATECDATKKKTSVKEVIDMVIYDCENILNHINRP